MIVFDEDKCDADGYKTNMMHGGMEISLSGPVSGATD